MSQAPPLSPCIKVCAVDSKTGWCIGCGRSIKEITNWVKMGPHGRDGVMSDLPERMETLRTGGKLGPMP